jgi:hypothetical protein
MVCPGPFQTLRSFPRKRESIAAERKPLETVSRPLGAID